MMIAYRDLRRILLVLPMLALAACNAVGEGNKIETLQIKDAIYGYDIAQPLQTFQCLRYNIAVLGTFTDGSSAFYTDRVTWSSSNPSVARVSNGDIQLPSNAALVYSKGTIIPVAPGTATITADYVGIKTSIQITVAAPTSISLVANSPLSPRPTATTITIAPRTVQSYAALAKLPVGGDTRTVDISGIGVWSTNPADTAAVLVSGSSFKGVTAGSATVNADFNQVSGACPLTITSGTLNVANIDTTANPPIKLSSEFDADNNPANDAPLVVGTTDRLKALATLVGGQTQDISELTFTGDGTTGFTTYITPTLPSSDSTISTVMGYTFNNVLRAVTSGTTADTNSANLKAAFPITSSASCIFSSPDLADNTKCVVSPALARSTQDGTLAAINICAVDASTAVNTCPVAPVSTTMKTPRYLQYGEDEARVQLRAIATFNLTGGGTVSQDVTRSVTWNSSNSTLISIVGGGSSPYQAGLAGSIKAGTVTVNATWSKDGVNTVTSNTLTLVAQ